MGRSDFGIMMLEYLRSINANDHDHHHHHHYHNCHHHFFIIIIIIITAITTILPTLMLSLQQIDLGMSICLFG